MSTLNNDNKIHRGVYEWWEALEKARVPHIHVRWIEKCTIYTGVNVFVFLISMMNWVFSCLVLYAC